jgi:hypothetical protein
MTEPDNYEEDRLKNALEIVAFLAKYGIDNKLVFPFDSGR